MKELYAQEVQKYSTIIDKPEPKLNAFNNITKLFQCQVSRIVQQFLEKNISCKN